MKDKAMPDGIQTLDENCKVKFGIGKKNFFGQGAVMLMALAIVFTIIGCWGQLGDKIFFFMHFALPVLGCLLFALCIYFLGKKGFFLSFIPVLLGAVFFAYKAFGCGNTVFTVLFVLYSVAAAVVYTCTMFGVIRTKWLLPPLFAAPFVYRVLKDLPVLSDTANPVTFFVGMREMAVLCMLLGMVFAGLGIKKRNPPPAPAAEAGVPVEDAVPAESETEAEPEAPEAEADAPVLTEEYPAEDEQPCDGPQYGQETSEPDAGYAPEAFEKDTADAPEDTCEPEEAEVPDAPAEEEIEAPRIMDAIIETLKYSSNTDTQETSNET